MKKKPRIETVKILSVRQPWASLIVADIKDVENRTWTTKYRGPLYIHASQRFDHEGYAYLIENGEKLFGVPESEVLPEPKDFHRGALIGRVILKDIVPFSDENIEELSAWHFAGNFGWYIENAEQFTDPIPMNGKLGLFSLDLDTAVMEIFTGDAD